MRFFFPTSFPTAQGASALASALSHIPLIEEPEGTTAGRGVPTAISSLPRQQASPLRLSPSLPLILAKLVAKTQALQYVEMKEYLPDNIELLKRMEAMDRTAFAGLPPSLRPSLREISSLTTWAYCFAQYIAVLAEAHPHLIRSRVAYMCLVISEARRNGGRGWSDYDALFRQHAAAGDQDPSRPDLQLDWSRLEPSLHASYLVGGRDKEGRHCRHCGGSDHDAEACALGTLATQSPSHNSTKPTHPSPTLSSKGKARMPPSVPVCIQWNRGDCRREACRYRHSCATCPGNHRASECPTTPQDSFYKRAVGRLQPTPSNPGGL